MSKTRLVYGLLALLTIWPALHIGLVKRYDLSPWKLAGWGMYSAPRIEYVGMEVFYRERGSDETKQLRASDPEIRRRADELLRRHRWLRLLAPPDGFAGALFARNPTFEELRVVVFRPDVDPETGMVVMRSVSYEYER